MKTPLEIIYKPFYLMADIALLAVSFHLAHIIRGLSYAETLHDQVMLLYSVFAWLIISKVTDFYSYNLYYKTTIKRYIYSFMMLGLTITLLAFLFKDALYSRLLLGYFIILFSASSILLHFVGNIFYSRLYKREYFQRNLLIVGAGRMGKKVYRQTLRHPEFGYNVIGFLEDNPQDNEYEKMVLGNTDNLQEVFQYYKVHEIVIALPMTREKQLADIINFAESNGVRLRLVPDIYRITPHSVEMVNFGDIPIFQFRSSPLDNPYNRLLKRSFDAVFSIFALLIMSPFLLFAIFGVKFSSKGPVFFVQKRTGYNQNNFNCYKFRSMRVVSKELQDSLQATEDDPRKTKFGDFLRKTNIDELPQFWNVLKGEMSVVGPRPHMLNHTVEFKQRVDKYLVRHFVKPGITGWAQVNGWRGPTDTDERLRNRIEYDLWYLENWTFWLDIKIILRTIFSNQSRLNAI
ncbi:MAG: undecaprenyl-phosphate glucose phosphotransferase [Calditrichales bacterium]|nr:undecaprenyl-phosphate glucose phosphotransferase [Calditrichales bacterium]